jgi:hypothetical protein
MLVYMLRVLLAVAGMVLAFPATAAADEGDYLRPLQDKYTFVSREQLLSEGSKVCDAMNSGVSATAAVSMVQRDLGVWLTPAVDIVAAASRNLGC